MAPKASATVQRRLDVLAAAAVVPRPSNREIARQLGVAESTVRGILQRFGAGLAPAAAPVHMDRGLLHPLSGLLAFDFFPTSLAIRECSGWREAPQGQLPFRPGVSEDDPPIPLHVFERPDPKCTQKRDGRADEQACWCSGHGT